MIFALLEPVALVGLVLGFAVAVMVRAVVQHVMARRDRYGQRDVLFLPRRDVDVFGVVAAVLGGTGWGKRFEGGRPAAFLAGPFAVIALSQLSFLAYRLLGGDPALPQLYSAASVLRGVPTGLAWERVLFSFAVSLLCFGLLALVPLPPLDGWGLLAHRAGPRPGQGFTKARHWLEEQNIGVVILLVGLIIPLAAGLPLFVFLLDVVTFPIIALWG